MDLTQQITDSAQLRTAYHPAPQGVFDKAIDHIDEGAAGFIARSPFVILATATEHRADASPRGGPPGFVRVVDRHRIAWGDLTGNNRLDSFGNVLELPNVGLLFMVPGVLETLRVAGTARLHRDPEILEACAIDGRLPKTAFVVTVSECYIQCGAAVRRSEIWNPTSWPTDESKPSAAAILKDHLGVEESAEAIAAGLANYYDNYIWNAGGRQD